MNIHLKSFKPDLNLAGRSNVVDATKNDLNLPLHTNEALYLTLNNLTASKPNWRFVIINTTTNHNDTERIATKFSITEDGEALGNVAVHYKGSRYRIQVSNDRISAKRDRATCYYTEDPLKAELAIRKNFFRQDKSERIDKAQSTITDVINSEANSKRWESSNARQKLMQYDGSFVLKHMAQYLQEYPQQVPLYETYKTAKDHEKVVTTIKDAVDNNKHLLVVLDGTQYITAYKGRVDAFNDETLPYHMREKLGLLKLVNDKQMVSDVGCRIDATTFVLLQAEEPKEQE